MIQTHFEPGPRAYDGTQLSSHFAYRTYGTEGDSIVAFVGPCQVDLSNMVDLEDVRNKAGIKSPSMLHFIIEHFDGVPDLEKAVLRQRLLILIVSELLQGKANEPISRRGDDLYSPEEGKLSVSIATRSPVSTLIHLGLNVVSGGAPVKTAGLTELGVAIEPFALSVLSRYQNELKEVGRAQRKVRGVN